MNSILFKFKTKACMPNFVEGFWDVEKKRSSFVGVLERIKNFGSDGEELVNVS